MADKQDINGTKYIGVRIKNDLYWQIREKLLKKRLSISEAIVNGLIDYLDIKVTKEPSHKITDIDI